MYLPLFYLILLLCDMFSCQCRLFFFLSWNSFEMNCSFFYRFNNALSLELTNDHPNMRIIHRKVALILGQWVSEVTSTVIVIVVVVVFLFSSLFLFKSCDFILLVFTSFLIYFLQIKDDTKRPVYCALIKLLQDRDLCVRV